MIFAPKNLPLRPESAAFAGECLATESDSLHQEIAQYKAQLRRLAADFENFKRRTRLESEARAGAQKEAFILELLPVIDNLERALAAGTLRDAPPVQQGVEMTLRQLWPLLRKHGIEAQECAGLPFDPSRHEAVARRCDPAHAGQTILKIFQRGYLRGEKVFRPAQVEVNDLTLAL